MKSKLILLITGCVFFVSCKKNFVDEKNQPAEKDVTVLYKEIATQILVTAKANENFRTIAYSECNKQKYGDYYVKLNELIALNANSKFWDAATVANLTNKQSAITQKTGRDVIIFVPSLEKHPEKAGLPAANIVGPVMNGLAAQEPVAVIADEYVPSDQTSRGYVVNNNGVLEFFQTIDESYAWENDIWVIGEEENVSPENMIAAPEDTAQLVYGRVNGGAEYGGIIKVTNWSLVEPWVLGKPEFRMVVYKGSATPSNSIYDEKFGKWRRANFNNQFHDFNRFLFNWNNANLGDWTTEKWIEEDGGTFFTLNFGVSFKIGGVTATAGVSLPIKNNDDDLGISLIQFKDPIGTEYSQSGIKIMRKN